MATIGAQLALPEVGWKRYDNANSKILHSGGMSILSELSFYNNTWSVDGTKEKNETIKFYFKSNKLRIISYVNDDTSYSLTSNMNICIDGKDYSANLYRTKIYSCLVFEIIDLEDCIHEVILSSNDKTKIRGISLDAIDIGENGYMVSPYLIQNKDIYKLKVGEYVNCNYSYANGFSNFYTDYALNFICVENNNKRAILVSDAVIPNLSFDEINQKGFIYGNEISHPFGEVLVTNIRSMTNTEYNKYIINSTLGGLITAGDKKIWNWDIASILSSAPADSSKITTMGGTSANLVSQTLTQIAKSTTYGFRPVLIIDKLRAFPTFTNSTQFGLHGDNLNLSITDISINNNITQEAETFDIFIKDSAGNIIYTKTLSVSDGSAFSYTIPKDLLNITNNSFGKLNIEIVDGQELSYSQEISVAIINNNIYVYDTRYISSNIHNANLKDNVIIDLDTRGNKLLFVITDNVDYINTNNLEKANINKKDIKIVAMLDKETTIDSFGLAFVN